MLHPANCRAGTLLWTPRYLGNGRAAEQRRLHALDRSRRKSLTEKNNNKNNGSKYLCKFCIKETRNTTANTIMELFYFVMFVLLCSFR